MLIHVFLLSLFSVCCVEANDKVVEFLEIIVVFVLSVVADDDDKTDAQNNELENIVAIDILRIKFLFIIFTSR